MMQPLLKFFRKSGYPCGTNRLEDKAYPSFVLDLRCIVTIAIEKRIIAIFATIVPAHVILDTNKEDMALNMV